MFWGGKFSKLTVWAFFDQNLTILGLICSFRPIFPNATINVPHFRHRNIFFGVLKNAAIFLGGKILKFDFFGIFLNKSSSKSHFFYILT